jgi:spore coat protein CotH
MKSLKLFTILSFLISNIVNAEVTFKVIAVNGTPSVIVNSKEYPMTVVDYPIYSVKVPEVSPPVQYHYKLNNGVEVVEESQERTTELSETLNDFFNRSITITKLPLLPKVYETPNTIKKSKLYDDNYVSTVIIKADEAAINNLHTNPTDKTLKVLGAQVIYVDPYDIRKFTDAKISINGQSTVKCKKLSYKISNLKTPEGKELYNRSAIKLRANYHDPSYIRDKLYSDVLNTLGVPVTQSKFSRVFINGNDIGLFTLADAVTNKRFIRSVLNNGAKFNVTNALFKADYDERGGNYGNLDINGDLGVYSYKGEEEVFDSNEKVNTILLPFIKEINQYPQTQQLNFDIESFFKFMVMEYAAGGVDNFWFRPGNYYLYKDMKKNYWHFLDADFHFSFGVGIGVNGIMSTQPLLDATIDTYTSANAGMPITSRPLIDNLRSNQANEGFFMDTFKAFTQKVFNLNALEKRIDAMADLIREDVYWDLKLEKVSKFNDPVKLKVYDYNENDFESQVKETGANSTLPNIFPIKYWIKTRQDSLATQLGITIPDKVDDSLGYYEPLVHKLKTEKPVAVANNTSDANARFSKSIYCGIVIYLLSYLLF